VRRLGLAASAIAAVFLAIVCNAGGGTPPPPCPPGGAAPAAASARLATNELVFDSDRTGNYEIFVMRADGMAVRQLTSDARWDSWWARPSPDRSRILFYRTPKGKHDLDFTVTALWSMNADGTAQRELRPPGTDGWDMQGHAEWSPSGARLVMFGGARTNPQIHATDWEGRGPCALTARGGTNIDPAWSPDGSEIAFVGCPAMVCLEKDYEIYVVPATGGEPRRLTSDQLRDHDPYYSPDGSVIAWLVQTEGGLPGVWNVFRMRADGSDRRDLTADRGVNSKPAWSLDGSKIYFHRLTSSGRWSIFVMDPDGKARHELTPGQPGNNEYPAN